MNGVCPDCANFGFVFDAVCSSDRCAHAKTWVTEVLPDGKKKHKQVRVMQCPPRSCTSCPQGADHARMLRRRARRQQASFA